mmetsp:Transcript_46805/g.105877  ORF Transcript_46805/g.105877 Transcript_46805/m.105877 type:complete len:583 (+) Transcript_46805:2012-3760(+)
MGGDYYLLAVGALAGMIITLGAAGSFRKIINDRKRNKNGEWSEDFDAFEELKLPSKPGGIMRRKRSDSSGSASPCLPGEHSIQLRVNDSASRNTVEALLCELVRLQTKSKDVRLSSLRGFSVSLENMAKAAVEIELPKRGGVGFRLGALNIAKLRSKMSLKDVNLQGKRVLMRVDYNCPTDDATQTITDPTRIETTIPSIQAAFDGGAKCVVLIAHRGRPGGAFNRASFTLEPCAAVLQAHFPNREVKFLSECVGPSVECATKECAPGTILILENLRFHFEECGSGVNPAGEKITPSLEQVKAFKVALSKLGDVYVFEGFGAAHRPHASIVGLAEAGSTIPTRVSGLLVEKEISIFADVLSTPRRPFLAIVGGSKVVDKTAVLENLLNLVDVLYIGGAMAYTFKKMLGQLAIGASLFDQEGARLVKGIMAKAKERKVKVMFPVDHVIADGFREKSNTGIVDDSQGVPEGWLALDMGPKSRAELEAEVLRSQTVLWNGPLGVCEMGAFAGGTLQTMSALVEATRRGATTVLGGGDTGAAARKFFVGGEAVSELVTHTSTGGGTSLVLMEGKELPAITALSDRE